MYGHIKSIMAHHFQIKKKKVIYNFEIQGLFWGYLSLWCNMNKIDIIETEKS